MAPHSSDFTHVLVYHLGPFVLFGVLLYAAIFVVIRLATRSNKPGKRKQSKAEGLNRQQRRQKQAVKRRQQRGCFGKKTCERSEQEVCGCLIELDQLTDEFH